MAPRSSEAETEHMETSTDFGSSSLKKRKADIPLQLDSAYSEEAGDGGSSEPEWGVDSFDGSDYVSSEEDEFSDAETERKWRLYKRQAYESKGFKVDGENIPKTLIGGIVPVKDLDKIFTAPGITTRQHMGEMASLALERYNREKGLNVKFEYLVRVNLSICRGLKAYITFMARESPEGDLAEYQAKVFQSISDKSYPIFCRPSPKPKD